MTKQLLSRIFLATFSSSFIFTAEASLADGLEAVYLFSGNPNDSSGNGNHGVNTGGVLTTDRFGNPNSAYHFAGPDDRIDIPTGFFSGNAGTVSLWLKADSTLTGATGTGSIYPFWVRGTRPGDSSPTPNEDFLLFFFGDGTTTVNGEMFGTFGGNGVHPHAAVSVPDFGNLDTAWHHAAFTSDSTGFHIYFDGVERIPTIFNDGITPASNLWPIANETEVKLGGNDSSDDIPKPFALDDVYIYGRALSSPEIGQLFAAGPAGVPESGQTIVSLLTGLAGLALVARVGKWRKRAA